MGEITFSAVLGMFLASWLILATLRSATKAGLAWLADGWLKTTRSYKGMVLAILIGRCHHRRDAGVELHRGKKDVRMTPGDLTCTGRLGFPL